MLTLRSQQHTLRFFSCLSLPSCPIIYLSRVVCLPFFGCLLAICVVSLPPPPNTTTCVPHWCFTNTCFHSTTLNPISFTTPPVTQLVLCSLHPTPRQHPLSPPDMSHLKPFSPLTPIITPTPHDYPRTNLVPWKIAINRAARGVFAEWDAYGFLFGVCDDAVWAILNIPWGNS